MSLRRPLFGAAAAALLALSSFFMLPRLKVESPRRSSEMSSSDTVRVVIVSDTHRVYKQPIPKGDIWIHAGDSELSPGEMEHWAKKLPHAHKIAVCGNMDYRLSNGKDKLQSVVYLQDSATTVRGLKVYGSPWTPEFVGVFQLEDDDAAAAVWEQMPSDVDLLITHGPPAGVLDRTSRGKRVGDGALLRKVEQVKPRVHCFGHIHESYGTEKKGDTLFCNAAVFNGHAPIVVDVPVRKGVPASVVQPRRGD